MKKELSRGNNFALLFKLLFRSLKDFFNSSPNKDFKRLKDFISS